MEIEKKTIIISKIKKSLIIYLILIAISAGLFWGINLKLNDLNDQITISQNKTNDQRDKLTELENKIRDIVEASKLWEKLNNKGEKRNGVEIDAFRILLSNLTKYYQINEKVDVSLTNPVEVVDANKKSSTIIVETIVSLSVSGISDELLLKFLDSLIKNTPGFIRIDSLEMNRKSLINQDVIMDAKKGKFDNLVDMKIIFNWRDFKDL